MVEVSVINLPLTAIHADEDFNCRGAIAPMDVIDLANDIEIRGLLQPILVCPYDVENALKTGYKYRLIAGFRRFTAHKIKNMDTIQCIVRKEVLNDIEAKFCNLAENVNRIDLNIMQEAKAIRKLHQLGVGEEETAKRLGKSRGWVQVRYLLIKLPGEVQTEIAAGLVSQTQIRELYTIFNSTGKEDCLEATKKLKEAKERGVKPSSINLKKANPDAKRIRKRVEIFEMIDHIMDDGIGAGLYTVTMAWCAGEVSDNELYSKLKEYASDNNLDYKVRVT